MLSPVTINVLLEVTAIPNLGLFGSINNPIAHGKPDIGGGGGAMSELVREHTQKQNGHAQGPVRGRVGLMAGAQKDGEDGGRYEQGMHADVHLKPATKLQAPTRIIAHSSGSARTSKC